VNEDRNEFKASLEWQKQECEKFANLVLKAERERSIFLKGDSSKEKIVFVIINRAFKKFFVIMIKRYF